MIQSMFAVTFTAYKDTKWLYSTVKYLFENAKYLNDANFSGEFYGFLDKLAKKYAISRFCDENRQVLREKLRYGEVSVFAFNLLDYVMWKNRTSLKNEFRAIRMDDFSFTYRRSIEHWYPQNPNKNLSIGARLE